TPCLCVNPARSAWHGAAEGAEPERHAWPRRVARMLSGCFYCPQEFGPLDPEALQPGDRIAFDPERGRFWGRLPGVRTVERDAARGALGVARGVRAARWGPRPGPAPDR